ncbi:hypothetical protein ACG3SL_13350 [Sphingomonas sp. CJ20]
MTPTDRLTLANDLASLLVTTAQAEALVGSDMRKVHERIDGELVRTFGDALAPLADLARRDKDGLAAAVVALSAAVARLQADLFALKAERLVGAGGEAPSNLSLLAAWEKPAADATGVVDVVVELGPTVLGHGWFVEDKGGGRFWRWLGPEPQAALVLPAFGPGTYELSTVVTALRADQLASLAVTVNGVPVVVKAGAVDGSSMPLHFTVELSAVDSNFLFLHFTIAHTLTPREVSGGEDVRRLGIGLANLRVRRVPPAASVGAG